MIKDIEWTSSLLKTAFAELENEERQHNIAWAKDGFGIFQCDGSTQGFFQIQKYDCARDISLDLGFDVPQLESDETAWRIVWEGNESGLPHCVAALAFVQKWAPMEYDRICNTMKGVAA